MTVDPKERFLPTFLNGHKYQIFSDVVDSWEDAEEYCEELNGHLAVITSKEEDDFLYQYIKKNGVKGAYFGLIDIDMDDWYWVDGTPVSYTNWHEDEPSSYDEPYGMYFYKFTDGTWNDADWGENTTAFICEWDPGSNPYAAPKTTYNGNKYQAFSGVAQSWEEAKAYCENLGGHLAVISDKSENDFLYKYITSNSIKGAYFGLYDPLQNGNWTWVYGNSTYTNWHQDEPSSNDEPYAMLFYKFTDGTWNDGKWADITDAFICEWEGTVETTTVTTSTTAMSTTTTIATTTAPVTTTAQSASVKISKIGMDDTPLSGATLKITGVAPDGITPINFTAESIQVGSDGKLINAASDSLIWLSGTEPTLVFVEDGTYTLEELVAPVGYMLAPEETFVVLGGKVMYNSALVDTVRMVDEKETTTSESTTTTTTTESTTTTTTTESTTTTTTTESTTTTTTTESTTTTTTTESTTTTTTTESTTTTTTTESTTTTTTTESTTTTTTTESTTTTTTTESTTTTTTTESTTTITTTESTTTTTTTESATTTESTSSSTESTSTTQTTVASSTGEQGSTTTETQTVNNLGDVNEDDKVDAKDASLILVEYSKASTGAESGLTESQKLAGEVNGDGKIDAKDASAILAYYAMASTATGDVPTLKEFITPKTS